MGPKCCPETSVNKLTLRKTLRKAKTTNPSLNVFVNTPTHWLDSAMNSKSKFQQQKLS